jgi:hypothetical protein
MSSSSLVFVSPRPMNTAFKPLKRGAKTQHLPPRTPCVAARLTAVSTTAKPKPGSTDKTNVTFLDAPHCCASARPSCASSVHPGWKVARHLPPRLFDMVASLAAKGNRPDPKDRFHPTRATCYPNRRYVKLRPVQRAPPADGRGCSGRTPGAEQGSSSLHFPCGHVFRRRRCHKHLVVWSGLPPSESDRLSHQLCSGLLYGKPTSSPSSSRTDPRGRSGRQEATRS